MKKIAILSLAAIAPLFAGEPEETLTLIQPQENSFTTFEIEMGGFYTLPTCHFAKGVDKVDFLGMDITAAYYITENWAITMRAAWAYGEPDPTQDMPLIGDNDIFSDDVDAHMWSMIPGIRYRQQIDENHFWFAGGGLGISSYDINAPMHEPDSTGMGYNFEVGLQWNLPVSTNSSQKEEYPYGYISVFGEGGFNYPHGIKNQFNIGIRAGVRIVF